MQVARLRAMPRTPRRLQHGEYHHVINRGNLKSTLFFGTADYEIFVGLLTKAVDRFSVSLLGYCIMPTHWHLVAVPATQNDMSRAMHWLTSVHAHAWSKTHERTGLGHVYQGRFLSIPIQPGINVCRVLRYVERNAAAAGLVGRAEDWPWCSAYQRLKGGAGPALLPQSFLPSDLWLEHLNAPITDREIGDAIRLSLPIGDGQWVDARYRALGIERARRRGRPARCART